MHCFILFQMFQIFALFTESVPLGPFSHRVAMSVRLWFCAIECSCGKLWKGVRKGFKKETEDSVTFSALGKKKIHLTLVTLGGGGQDGKWSHFLPFFLEPFPKLFRQFVSQLELYSQLQLNIQSDPISPVAPISS